MTSSTVLIVSGGGFQGLALVKALRAVGGLRVLLADCHAENVARYFADGYYRTPMLQPPGPFLDFALALCEREAVTAVFAATNHELPLLASHRADFAALGATVFVPEAALLDLANDKLRFYRWLEAQGLPCLPCYAAPDDRDAALPLIGKPRYGWGGRGIRVLTTRDAVATLPRDELDEYVWQPCLSDFDEYSVDFAVSDQGAVSPLAFRRRVRVLGGFAILGEPWAPETVREAARHAIDELLPLGACGPMNLQLLHTEGGCWLTDLNPRIGTSMPLSLAAGHNPVAFLLAADREGSLPSHAGPQDPAGATGARALRFLEERFVPALDLNDVGGVVFDLDDTLLDQKEWMLSKLEITWTRARAVLPGREDFLGLGLRIIEEGNRARLFDALCEELGLDDATRHSLIDTYRAAEPARGRLYDDARPCLMQLRRMGYRLGLLTDNPPASQRLKVRVCGLEPCFDALIYTGELGAHKPDGQAFAACAQTLGLPADRLAMVGDNLFRDIRGALAAGYRHAFAIQRPGGFFNFNPALARRAGVALESCTTLSGLHELMWHLHGPAQ